MRTLQFHTVNEAERIYTFPCGEKIELKNVSRIAISRTTHRLELKTGEKVIIPTGWLCIHIKTNRWEF